MFGHLRDVCATYELTWSSSSLARDYLAKLKPGGLRTWFGKCLQEFKRWNWEKLGSTCSSSFFFGLCFLKPENLDWHIRWCSWERKSWLRREFIHHFHQSYGQILTLTVNVPWMVVNNQIPAGDWDCVAAVERLPALHFSVDFIFLPFGIMGFIVEFWNY